MVTTSSLRRASSGSTERGWTAQRRFRVGNPRRWQQMIAPCRGHFDPREELLYSRGSTRLREVTATQASEEVR